MFLARIAARGSAILYGTMPPSCRLRRDLRQSSPVALRRRRAYAKSMKFSLIVATIGRSAELVRLLDSLTRQNWSDLEVIIVDQNSDRRVADVVDAFADRLQLIRLTSRPGATRARNVGLVHATGDVIGFPDDDCWYPGGLLQKVAGFLGSRQEWDGIIGHTIDAAGTNILPWGDSAGRLTPAMSWRRSVTYAYFLRRKAVQAAGQFDESLGPGAGTPWGAGDDNDYMLSALKAGARVFFDPDLKVHHPPLFPGFGTAALAKRASYARADGRVLRKHPMPLWWMAAFFAVPLARFVLALPLADLGRLRFHWVTFRGRWQGYFDPAGSTRRG